MSTLSVLYQLNQIPNKSGVYCLRHLPSGRVYIGSSVKMKDRIKNHLRGKSLNLSMRLTHPEEFSIYCLEICNEAQLIEREKYHVINQNSIYPNGFNMVMPDKDIRTTSIEMRSKMNELRKEMNLLPEKIIQTAVNKRCLWYKENRNKILNLFRIERKQLN